MTLERIGAFVEYVARPLTEDIRIIFERAKDLNLPISEKLIKQVGLSLGLWHLTGEIIRAISYAAITWIVCETVIVVLTPSLFR